MRRKESVLWCSVHIPERLPRYVVGKRDMRRERQRGQSIHHTGTVERMRRMRVDTQWTRICRKMQVNDMSLAFQYYYCEVNERADRVCRRLRLLLYNLLSMNHTMRSCRRIPNWPCRRVTQRDSNHVQLFPRISIIYDTT